MGCTAVAADEGCATFPVRRSTVSEYTGCLSLDAHFFVCEIVSRRFRQIDAAGLEENNMEENLGRMKLFNARRKFKSAIQTVIVADRLRKFTEGMASMSTN